MHQPGPGWGHSGRDRNVPHVAGPRSLSGRSAPRWGPRWTRGMFNGPGTAFVPSRRRRESARSSFTAPAIPGRRWPFGRARTCDGSRTNWSRGPEPSCVFNATEHIECPGAGFGEHQPLRFRPSNRRVRLTVHCDAQFEVRGGPLMMDPRISSFTSQIFLATDSSRSEKARRSATRQARVAKARRPRARSRSTALAEQEQELQSSGGP
jgi:hypothetical protein